VNQGQPPGSGGVQGGWLFSGRAREYRSGAPARTGLHTAESTRPCPEDDAGEFTGPKPAVLPDSTIFRSPGLSSFCAGEVPVASMREEMDGGEGDLCVMRCIGSFLRRQGKSEPTSPNQEKAIIFNPGRNQTNFRPDSLPLPGRMRRFEGVLHYSQSYWGR